MTSCAIGKLSALVSKNSGLPIPVLREDENTQNFGFIMPESDVRIEIFPAETE